MTDRPSEQSPPDERTNIERAFFKDGRLVSLPAQRKKRTVVLERLLQEFETDRLYTEPEVNAILKRFHDDVATLRREFINTKMMTRSGGNYQRIAAYTNTDMSS